MKQIFPKEILENTQEVHYFKHSKKSGIIYNIITLALIATVVLLPFIKITVYSTSQGYIKPLKERVILQTIQSGKVIYQNLKNNQKVHKGDTLLMLDNQAIKFQKENTKLRIDEVTFFINDLKYLLNNRTIKMKEILTSVYRQEYGVYQQKRMELQTRYKKIKADYLRDQNLLHKGVIAQNDFNTQKLAYSLAKSNLSQHLHQQKNKWQTQLTNYKNNLRELQNTTVQLQKSSQLFILKAPDNGTLLQTAGINNGSFITAGTSLAQLSPKTELQVECYVNPSDIGLLKVGTATKFQIHAFNYNQWGLADGVITSIGSDVELINNAPVFKVKCSLQQTYLQLKNGFKGQLKKGMSVNVRFKLTKRSLFDLLYDQMDDWLNPNA